MDASPDRLPIPTHAAEKLTLLFSPTTGLTPSYIAKDHGIFAKHGLDVRRAAIGLGPSAENRFVESRVGDAEDAIRSEAILIQRSVLRRPVLLDQVEAPDVHLQEIPEQWHSFRPREIIEGPTRRDA